MECVFLWKCILCLPNAIILATLIFVMASLTSQCPHSNQVRERAPPGFSSSAALENPTASGLSCSSHLHPLPALTPLLLLVCSASHFPLKSPCFLWQKRAARWGCLQHWFGGKIEGKCIAILERGKWSYPKSSFSHEPETVVSGPCPISIISLVYSPTLPEFCLDAVFSLTLLKYQLPNLYTQTKRKVNYWTCD